jgi:hypothetical protein
MTPSSNNLSANKICRGDPKSKTKTAKKKRKEKKGKKKIWSSCGAESGVSYY